MDIKSFIKEEVLSTRLQKKQVLAVYDPECRYRDLCLEMAEEKRIVVDASESSITSRAQAIEALTALGRNEIEQLLIYVPTSKPIEEEEKQKDPFALYLACGSVFPDGDGDTYLSLCLKAKPDHPTQVRTVFAENPDPGFAVIDAIGGGLSWPNLRALLSMESTRDILFASFVRMKTASSAQRQQLGCRRSLQVSLGLSLKPKGKTWSSIADELWRYLLFSEFIFDLPEKLPGSLANVPHADNSAQPLIEDLCERLRNDQRSQIAYIHHAEIIETELNMEQACKDLSDLGKQDTFPFEERTFLSKAVESFKNEELDEAREILLQHSNSIWVVGEKVKCNGIYLGPRLHL